MKIHKKILTHFLSCTSPVDKEGYLYKKKKRNGIYHRRWFVLKANLLFYQERPADRHLLGVIVLEGCTVMRTEADVQFAFSVAFQGPELKTYRFAAADGECQESWMRSLLLASHCYLSLLLRDLRGQYEEASQRQGGFPPGHTIPTDDLRPPAGPLAELGPPAEVRKDRSQTASAVLHPPKKGIGQKCSVWLRRNTAITPLTGPAASNGEWPSSLSPLDDFRKLHDYYGEEVKKVRAEWLERRGEGEEEEEEEQRGEEDLIDLG